MMEFEINMSEMPLGKLSKHNIQKGKSYLSSFSFYLFLINDEILVLHHILLCFVLFVLLQVLRH